MAKTLDPLEMLEVVRSYVGKEKCNILDIGSDKPPKCALMFANWFGKAEISHYRDHKKKLSEKEKKRFKKDNLSIICAEDLGEILGSEQDLATGIFSLHTPDDPYAGIQTAYNHLSSGGKIFIFDYDLTWFNKLAKDNRWSEEEALNYFSREVFTTGNECAFLGLKEGEKYNHKKIDPESNCLKNHTRFGLREFETICSEVGFKRLKVIQDKIKTSFGEFPKQFIYLGEK